MTTVIITAKQMENGFFKVAYDGRILGDSRSFDTAEQALASIAHKDGQQDGRWEGSNWIDVTFKVEK